MKDKICSVCGRSGKLWRSIPKLCKICASRVKKPPLIRKLSDKAKEKMSEGKRYGVKKKIPKPSGELILFKAIWETRPHVCAITGEPINEFNVSCFMHILSKGAYPKFRLFDKNILLVTPQAHTEYDCGDRSAPEFAEVMKLHDELVREYYTQ